MSTLERKYSSGNSLLMTLVFVVVVAAIAALAYLYWGKTYMASLNPSPSATASPLAYATPTPSSKTVALPTKSPTPTPTPVERKITVGSTLNVEGFEASNGGGNITTAIQVGRNSNLIERGFVSFLIPTELTGRQVDTAVMRLYQGKIVGSPYVVGGNMMVDHVSFGTTLDNSAYNLTALSPSFASLTANAVVEYKDVSVRDQLVDDLGNGRTYSQYRLHFATEAVGGDTTGDFTYFEAQDNSMGSGNQPQLVITYH